MNRLWKILRSLLASSLFSPRGLLARAAVLLTVFGIFHLLGWRDDTRIFSGTSLPSSRAVVCGLLYAAAYFSAILLCPIMILAAGINAVFLRLLSRERIAVNTMQFACVISVLWALIGLPTARCAAGPTMAQKAVEPIAELKPGKAAGTFRLIYHARAAFSMPGYCAMAVSIRERYHADITALLFDEAKDFTAEADLRPGSYSVTVSPINEKTADYCPSDPQIIHIDKAGRLYQPLAFTPEPGVFTLDRRMKDLSPSNLAIADERQPVLKWPAVAGATHYRGILRDVHGTKWFDVEETQYRIGGGVGAGEPCFWQICARDAHDKTLARGEGSFLGHGTEEAAVALMRAAAQGTCGAPPPPNGAFLGVEALPTQVPKDPAKPIVPNENGSSVIQDEAHGFIPGIAVVEVLPGSPAVDADIHPDDVILAIDGQGISSEDHMGDHRAFIRQIAEMEPGRQIALTVRRFPQEMTLHATIGRYPGTAATTQATIAAVTTTAPSGPDTTAASAPASKAAWREASAGSPATHAFHVDAGADIPRLSSNEGLAADWIKCMAELPNGGMAFGTGEGLSVWDGNEIRTYTGPSYSSVSGGVVDGNSGLPGNDIQDLLCDSRGRLWVATGRGVCRIDPASPEKWKVLENPERGASSHREADAALDVQRVFESSDGSVILAARGAGITVINPKTDQPTLLQNDGDMNHWVTGIAEDTQHRLWFSVFGVGVLRFDGTKVEPIHGPWDTQSDLCGLCIDHTGTVWVGLGKAGLCCMHADGKSEKIACEDLAGGYVSGVSVDHSGRVDVSCERGFAVRDTDSLRGKEGAWQFVARENNFFGSIVKASDGSWWMSGGAVSRSRKLDLSPTSPDKASVERFKRETEQAYPNVKSDRLTAVAAGKAVVGAAGQHLLRFDGKKWEDLTSQFEPLDVVKVRADSKGSIWIATSGQGVIGIDPAGAVHRYNNDPTHAKSVIYDLDEAPDGTIYVGSQYGVFRFRGGIWEQIPSDLFQVGQVLVDRRGRVWMIEVTYDKLYVYDGTHFREVKEQTALSNEKLECGSLRLDNTGGVLVNIPAQPAAGKPKRTFRWDAALDGKIGEPVEVK